MINIGQSSSGNSGLQEILEEAELYSDRTEDYQICTKKYADSLAFSGPTNPFAGNMLNQKIYNMADGQNAHDAVALLQCQSIATNIANTQANVQITNRIGSTTIATSTQGGLLVGDLNLDQLNIHTSSGQIKLGTYNQIQDVQGNLNTESSTRQTNDNTLQTNINAKRAITDSYSKTETDNTFILQTTSLDHMVQPSSVLTYSTNPSLTTNNNIPNKKYVDDTYVAAQEYVDGKRLNDFLSPSSVISYSTTPTISSSLNIPTKAYVDAQIGGITTGITQTQADARYLQLVATGDENMNSHKITSLASGTLSTDAVNKGQMDSADTGLQGQITTLQNSIPSKIQHSSTNSSLDCNTSNQISIKSNNQSLGYIYAPVGQTLPDNLGIVANKKLQFSNGSQSCSINSTGTVASSGLVYGGVYLQQADVVGNCYQGLSIATTNATTSASCNISSGHVDLGAGQVPFISISNENNQDSTQLSIACKNPAIDPTNSQYSQRSSNIATATSQPQHMFQGSCGYSVGTQAITSNGHFSSKKYVDDQVATKTSTSTRLDQFAQPSSVLSYSTTPTISSSLNIPTKAYVDSAISGVSGITQTQADARYYQNTVPLQSITLASGDLNMNTHKITGVVDPVNPQDVATKNYVDNASGSSSSQIINGVVSSSKLVANQTEITLGLTPLNVNSQKIIGLANGTLGTDAVNKNQLDDKANTTALAGYYANTVPLQSITLATGQLNMNSNRIVSVVDPISNQDVSTKKYVDDQITAHTVNTISNSYFIGMSNRNTPWGGKLQRTDLQRIKTKGTLITYNTGSADLQIILTGGYLYKVSGQLYQTTTSNYGQVTFSIFDSGSNAIHSVHSSWVTRNTSASQPSAWYQQYSANSPNSSFLDTDFLYLDLTSELTSNTYIITSNTDQWDNAGSTQVNGFVIQVELIPDNIIQQTIQTVTTDTITSLNGTYSAQMNNAGVFVCGSKFTTGSNECQSSFDASTGSSVTIPNKGYVDAKILATTPNSLATCTGSLAMGTQKITGLLAGTSNDHAVNLGQMNTAISNQGIQSSIISSNAATGISCGSTTINVTGNTDFGNYQVKSAYSPTLSFDLINKNYLDSRFTSYIGLKIQDGSKNITMNSTTGALVNCNMILTGGYITSDQTVTLSSQLTTKSYTDTAISTAISSLVTGRPSWFISKSNPPLSNQVDFTSIDIPTAYQQHFGNNCKRNMTLSPNDSDVLYITLVKGSQYLVTVDLRCENVGSVAQECQITLIDQNGPTQLSLSTYGSQVMGPFSFGNSAHSSFESSILYGISPAATKLHFNQETVLDCTSLANDLTISLQLTATFTGTYFPQMLIKIQEIFTV